VLVANAKQTTPVGYGFVVGRLNLCIMPSKSS
jgi:hypothetical protein